MHCVTVLCGSSQLVLKGRESPSAETGPSATLAFLSHFSTNSAEFSPLILYELQVRPVNGGFRTLASCSPPRTRTTTHSHNRSLSTPLARQLLALTKPYLCPAPTLFSLPSAAAVVGSPSVQLTIQPAI